MMQKFGGTRYNSRWDGSTWFMVAIVAAWCVVPCFLDDGLWAAVICFVMLAFVFVTLIGIYYRIDGDKLVVYTFFRPSVYPIDKIKEIKPTKSVLSSPATSLTHRLAITFTDRSVLKSTMPIIISPVRQAEFIRHLRAINPSIVCEKMFL